MLRSGEICYAEGSYYIARDARGTATSSLRYAKKTSSSAITEKLSKMLYAIKTQAQPPPVRPGSPAVYHVCKSAGVAPEPLPDASFAMPMRERYLHHTASKQKALPPPAALPPAPPTTLLGLTPERITALSAQVFAACFEATPLRALTKEQLAAIDGHETLKKIAHEVLDRKAPPPAPAPARIDTLVGLAPERLRALSTEAFTACFEATPLHALTKEQLAAIDANEKLRAIAHEVLDRKQKERKSHRPETGLRVFLPPKLQAFVVEQVEAGLYNDPNELINECVRRMWREFDVRA